MTETFRKVRVSVELIDKWASRTESGDLITAEWGEPDADGFYDPIFRESRDDNLLTKERERIRAAVETYRAHVQRSDIGIWRLLAIVDGPA